MTKIDLGVYPPEQRKNITIDINRAQAYSELMREGIKNRFGVNDSDINVASHLLIAMDGSAWLTARTLWGLGQDQQVAANFAQMARKGNWNVMGVKPERYEEYLGHVFNMTVVSEKIRMAQPNGASPDREIVNKIKAEMTGTEVPKPVEPNWFDDGDSFPPISPQR